MDPKPGREEHRQSWVRAQDGYLDGTALTCAPDSYENGLQRLYSRPYDHPIDGPSLARLTGAGVREGDRLSRVPYDKCVALCLRRPKDVLEPAVHASPVTLQFREPNRIGGLDGDRRSRGLEQVRRAFEDQERPQRDHSRPDVERDRARIVGREGRATADVAEHCLEQGAPDALSE